MGREKHPPISRPKTGGMCKKEAEPAGMWGQGIHPGMADLLWSHSDGREL